MNSKTRTIGGCALVAAGAWIGLAPFVAGTWAWEWDLGRFLLTVAPAAAVIIGGLTLVAGSREGLVTFGGALALSGGLWLIVGPLLHTLVAGPELGTTPEGGAVRMLEMIPFFFGAGILVAFISSYVAGFLRPLEFDDEMWAEPVRARRARVPMPPERPRRQRGVREPALPLAQRRGQQRAE